MPDIERGSARRCTPAWPVALAAAILLGAVFRLVWPSDIEYKADERWTFERAQRPDATESFASLGMPSSVLIRNPGLSVWIFVLLAKVSGADDPPALARAVQLLAIVAILLLLAFVLRRVPAGEREPWLWAVALVSLSPLLVLFHRKIWPPSVLPVFSVAMLVGWWTRETRRGAFLWGLAGMLLGQIHVSGFFFAGGFVTWALLFSRRGVRWVSWIVGSCLGALPLLPWLPYLASAYEHRPAGVFNFVRWLELRYWMRWVTEPLGLSLEYSLGGNFHEFLSYPLVGGAPTYLALILHGSIVVLGGLIFARAARRLWRERHDWRALWIGRGSATAFTICAALWGCGLLLTASALQIHRHYMLVTFPLQFVWLARVALASGGPGRLRPSGRIVLLGLCLAQAALSATYLGYIHVKQGAPLGDYGTTYGGQLAVPGAPGDR